MNFEPRDRHPYFSQFDDAGYPKPRRRRGLFVFLAVFWLAAGISLIGTAGYMYWDSTQSSQTWVYVRPVWDETVVAGAAEEPAGSTALGGAGFRLVVDKIGVDAPVAPFGLGDDTTPDVPYEKDLVAWYDFSAYPGTGENAVLAGHVTYYGDAVFKHIEELQEGDLVRLVGDDAGELVYRVSGKTLIDPEAENGTYYMQPAGAGDILTIITCGGEHFSDPDIPILQGGYTHRLVVRAELVAEALG